jgi:retron-type reverse transcriptase
LRNRSGKGKGYKKYILDADLKDYFDKISHEYLVGKLKTSPKISKQIIS